MKIPKKIAWMIFVSRRFARVDNKGISALTSLLSSLGICFGVMTLIVVMAVMNGFQLGYIESILEISSYHARIESDSLETIQRAEEIARENSLVRNVTPFYEEQALVVGNNSRQQAGMLRFVPRDILSQDEGLASQVNVYIGDFTLQEDTTVIGSSLARALGVTVGDYVNILLLSGSSDVELLSDTRVFKVAGIFYSDYTEINDTFMFFSLEAAQNILGQNRVPSLGIKLRNSNDDTIFSSVLKNELEKENLHTTTFIESWRSYNRAFFGALRVEKILLMLLVFLIFIVVGVNIFNSMRRMVFERREDIAILSALGSTSANIQSLFIFRGLLIGITGALSGLLLGMLLSVQMDNVFLLISKITYYIQYVFVLVFNSSNVHLVTENPMFSFYAQIPTRMDFTETALITLFGILSALVASWVASRNILKLYIAEVLRYE